MRQDPPQQALFLQRHRLLLLLHRLQEELSSRPRDRLVDTTMDKDHTNGSATSHRLCANAKGNGKETGIGGVAPRVTEGSQVRPMTIEIGNGARPDVPLRRLSAKNIHE